MTHGARTLPRRKQTSDHPTGYLFTAPALVLLTACFFLPAVLSFFLSFTDFDIYAVADPRQLRWVGVDNYRRLLATPLFWKALTNTLLFVAVAGPLTILLSLTSALLLTSKSAWGSGLFRVLLFAPVGTTMVAVAVIWRYLFHTEHGLVNRGLEFVGLTAIDWLGSPGWAMCAIILLGVWKNFGYNMVIFIAGLQNIPREMYEAAATDGANAFQRLWYLTLPLLAPTFLFVGITTAIGYLQLFAEPYVMTKGGPLHSTYSLVMMMYEEGFRWWNLGFAAAIAFVLFLFVLAASLVLWFFSPREKG